jgi:MFS family permease
VTAAEPVHFLDAFKIPDIRLFLASVAFSTLANRSMLVIIGFQIYQLTRSPAALGWLGLVEAIPAMSQVLFGGYIADHFNRRAILLITQAASCLCAVALVGEWITSSTDARIVISRFGCAAA